jgi:predicted Fe-Mo cluster-binding NifX family protein
MKIAIPTDDKKGLESRIAEHFGRANYYTFLDENGKILEIIDNTSEDKGGSGLPPELIKNYGATSLLCKAIGPKAVELCKKWGIEVYIKQAETVTEIFNLFKREKCE